ncbi:MAG: hypothetical protein ABIG68_04000 [Acidobacteriota bacterium]
MSRIRVTHSGRNAAAWLPVFLLLVGSFLAVLLFDKDLYLELVREGANTELLTALFYLFTGISFLVVACRRFRTGRSVGKVVLLVLLGAWLVFIGGEEESWGQWQFHYRVPDAVREVNLQKEVNLHNLSFLKRYPQLTDPHRILNLFILVSGILIPVAYKYNGRARALLNRLSFPVCPFACVPLFVLALVYEKTAMAIWYHWSHTEATEFLFAVGILLYGIGVLRGDCHLPDRLPAG